MAICPKCNKQELNAGERLCPRCENKSNNFLMKILKGAVLVVAVGAVGVYRLFKKRDKG